MSRRWFVRAWVRLEWKPADMWVGLFWRKGNGLRTVDGLYQGQQYDAWVCLVPMIPIHFGWIIFTPWEEYWQLSRRNEPWKQSKKS